MITYLTWKTGEKEFEFLRRVHEETQALPPEEGAEILSHAISQIAQKASLEKLLGWRSFFEKTPLILNGREDPLRHVIDIIDGQIALRQISSMPESV